MRRIIDMRQFIPQLREHRVHWNIHDASDSHSRICQKRVASRQHGDCLPCKQIRSESGRIIASVPDSVHCAGEQCKIVVPSNGSIPDKRRLPILVSCMIVNKHDSIILVHGKSTRLHNEPRASPSRCRNASVRHIVLWVCPIEAVSVAIHKNSMTSMNVTIPRTAKNGPTKDLSRNWSSFFITP